ncbi:cytoplasmic protein, variant 2 [Coprinopsis cinerea AmutBmut pab1-1]|nr:cytoplasmic protein, variant 2 [Coprinopsis cinerea AmutBmut pab1-1]
MQHLRPVGIQEEGVESILIEAPATSKNKRSGKQTLELPKDTLPPTYELPRTYESQQAIPESIAGFQPDMDPHLRQVLEALEDDAFVDDGLEDDFFQELVGDGERGSDEDFDFEFEEDGVQDQAAEGEEAEPAEETWEDRFKKFKQEQRAAPREDSDDGLASEGGDTIRSLQTISVIGGKKRRRKGSSVASGYSMSSSSMYRHEGLQTLDERFDQMMLKQYGEDEDEDEEDHEGDHEHMSDSDEDSDEAPELITSRDDFDSMVNEFLNDYEILGRKMRPKLEGETGLDKLDTLRRAVGEAKIREGQDNSDSDEDLFIEEEDKKDRWDCETILTTYSNLENHPRLIRARDSKPVPKIVLDTKTGMPSVVAPTLPKVKDQRVKETRKVTFSNSEDTDGSDDEDSAPRGPAVGRPRNESKEEKKARKAAAKAAKQSRRVEKKAMQVQFDTEIRDQKKKLAHSGIKMKKL